MTMTKQSSNARKKARKRALKKAKQEGTASAEPSDTKGGKNEAPKKRKLHHQQAPPDDESEEDDLLAIAAAWANNKSVPDEESKRPLKKEAKSDTAQPRQRLKNVARKPPKFPKNIPLPLDGFLKDEEPYCQSFDTALKTAYEGCVWDEPVASQEAEIQKALFIMDESGLFRTDVTQPAGLGAKLVPSYVTRCLLGEPGTTYRYLGLRMFSHPWNGSGQQSSDKKKIKLRHAIQAFESLNHRLTDRTEQHLKTLQSTRQKRNETEPVIQGKSNYNVTLINKMTVHKKLRDEPMFGTSKYSVGWHADSSLEHFSAIAVHQTIVNSSASPSQQQEGPWSVALRVTHDAEGPRAKRLGDIAVEEQSPPIQVELPSGSTYYLLDDFNHHHQHAVLAPPNPSATSIRYSSTHRLLRKGHNVEDILARCKTICDNFHRHGSKRWRSEQLLLTEVENEWLRQFFIQGPFHKQIHWGYWEKPICELLQYWEKLEARTQQIVLFLKQASEERCGLSSNKGKESVVVIEQIKGDRSPREAIYNSVASLISERARTRDQWVKRERDPVFKRLSPECHPIPFPVNYGSQSPSNDCMVTSPLPDGSAAFLTELATNIKAWGVAFEDRSKTSLPKKEVI